MRIHVNGAAYEAQAGTLAALLDELGFGARRVATARNGRFVAIRQRAETILVDGDMIEIVAPMQGG